jgi:hypothetical protein
MAAALLLLSTTSVAAESGLRSGGELVINIKTAKALGLTRSFSSDEPPHIPRWHGCGALRRAARRRGSAGGEGVPDRVHLAGHRTGRTDGDFSPGPPRLRLRRGQTLVIEYRWTGLGEPPGKTYAEARADGTLRESPTWWVKYYDHGRAVRESTEATKDTEARRFLNERVGRVATSQPILPRVDRVTYDEAATDLRRHYETTESRDVEEADWRLAHLKPFFSGFRLATIGPVEATRYAAKRQAEGAANGTINRELAILGRMLRLAYEHDKLRRLPVLKKLKEAGARQGFFEAEQYQAVRRHLAPDLQVITDVAYTYGWRMQSEVLTFERRQLDLKTGTLRLDPGTTKNDEGRIVYLTPALAEALAAQVERVEKPGRKLGRVIPCLFPHLRGAHRGERIRDFRKAWRAPARPPVSQGASATTSGGRPCATWSTGVSSSAWP